MTISTTENDVTMKLSRVAAVEPPDASGRHRASAPRANGRETPRKAAKRAVVRWLTAARVVGLRVWSPLRAQWFRVWPPLLGMVVGFLIDLSLTAVLWHRLTT